MTISRLQPLKCFLKAPCADCFSMLFGAGMVLFMTNKKEVPGKPTVSEYYYRRLLWLVFFGIINAFVILWHGDILFYYGLFGMLLFAVRKAAPKWLLVLGLACISFGMITSQWRFNETREKRATYLEAKKAKQEKKKLTPEQQEAIGWWEARMANSKPDTAAINTNMRKMHSGYGTIFTYYISRNAENEAGGTYYGIWDMLSMMLIGMALLKWGFFSNQLRTSTYSMWLLIGYGVGIPIGLLLCKIDFATFNKQGEFIDRWISHPWVWAESRRLLITVGHASLLMLLYRSQLVPWLMKALAAVGQMAFTNYLMQSIICTIFFYGYGFGYYGNLHLHQIYYVVGAVWIFQIIFSVIWLKYFRFGPFEWLWRSLTYWKAQPMKL